MNTELERIEAEVLRLPVEDRERLVERLLLSLQSDCASEAPSSSAFASPEIERAWIEESRHRFELMKSGEMATYPAEEVFARLEARLRR